MDGPSNPIPNSELLIAEVGWIRELARQMVSDAHRADDLAQEACVVALESRPRDVLSVRSWLRTVMHNLVRQKHRGDVRRLAREARAARAERIEATDDLVERASLQRRVVEAVFELEEPYRSAILWRYFEGEPPRDIARRLGVPVTTVQSRLKRGLQRLRERLDVARENHGAWLALLLPVSTRSPAPLAWTLGGVIVNAKLVLALVSVAVVATVVGIAGLDRAEAPLLVPAAQLARDAHAPDLVALQGPLTVTREAAPALAALESATPDASPTSAPHAQPATIRRARGRVLDGEGLPIGGLALVFQSGEKKTPAKSGAGGWFELDTDATEGTFGSDDPAYATLRNGTYRATSSFEPIVIAARAIEVGGSVLDPERAPVRGARVSLALPKGFETRFGQVLELTRKLDWSARTDERGRFTLAGLPQVAGASLRVLVDGYQPAILPEPEFSDPTLCFVLERPTVLATGALRGRVLHPDGSRASGARVATGVTSTLADDRGEFALDLSRAVTAERITAVKVGFRPATMERPDAPEGANTGWPDFVELVLGGPPLSIRGRVVDAEDHPRAGMRVWIADPTPFGLIGKMPVQNENLMAGAAIPSRALEPDPNPPREDGDSVDMHRNAGGPPTACWYWVETDENGRFALDGLDDREYVVKVLDPVTLQAIASDPIRAGNERARIVVPPPATYAKLAGRVVTIGDRPVAGVRMIQRYTAFEVNQRYFGGKLSVLMMSEGGATTTDAEGRFELKNVPRDGVFFVLRADGIVPCDWHVPEGADPEHLDVRVDVRCQLEVRLSPPLERADSIALLDEHGDEVDLIVADQESISLNSEVALVRGRSGIVSASSSARVLEIRKDGKAVESIPITLVPGGVNVIEK